MHGLNTVLVKLFDVILVAPAGLFPEAGLWIVSVVLGVVMVLIFGKVSDQKAIARTKDTIKAHLLSLSLYPHELGLAFRTYGRIFGNLGVYLALLLAPTIVLLVPFVVVAVQLEMRYGRQALRPGESAVVSARFGGGGDGAGALPGDVALRSPEGVVVETPPVRIPREGEVAWRVRATGEGTHDLVVAAGGEEYSKSLHVGTDLVTLSPERPAGLLGQILYPVEPPLEGDGGPVSIRVEYPRADVSLLSWRTHWMVFFVLVSVGVALVARIPLKVDF